MYPRLTLICGVDEAGRGPLAGPVYAAAVILPPGHGVHGIADSKTLSPSRRQQIASDIRARASDWAIAYSSVEEIDRLNILQAALLAMKRAVELLRCRPDEVLVDGKHCPSIDIPTRAVVGGDTSVESISAASILAKTARDAAMLELHSQFPQYAFDRHKGYPTAEHLEKLLSHGPSPVHRRSFGPVRRISGS